MAVGTAQLDAATRERLFHYLLEIGDDLLVLGHRLSEWCGHGPFLEEDIALGNLALDCIGQATNLLHLAGEVEGKQQSEDDLAFLRPETAFRNCLLVEHPNGDFALTIVRQFLFDTLAFLQFEALSKSAFEPLAAIAQKSFKETAYHLRHAREWLIRLGDGTSESRTRAQTALNELWRFTDELFEMSPASEALCKSNIVPDLRTLKTRWLQIVRDALEEATLQVPSEVFMLSGGRSGRHTEQLGYLLAVMQSVPRAHPGNSW